MKAENIIAVGIVAFLAYALGLGVGSRWAAFG